MGKPASVLKQVSSQKDVWRMCNLAMKYELGSGVEKDISKAVSLYKQASDMGSGYAKSKLGDLARNYPELKAKILSKELQYEELVDHEVDRTLDNLDHSEQHHTLAIRKKVLIVDDSPDTVLIFKKILEARDVIVFEASNGKEAFECVRSHPEIACVFVDLQMPEMNGFEFISLIRKMHLIEDVPIVVETAHTNRTLVSHGKEKGVTAWVMKPIEQSKILSIVDKLL